MFAKSYSESGQGIFHGRNNARDCRDRSALAGALHADRIERGSNLEMLDLNPRHIRSGRQKIFAVVRRQRLPVPIIQHLLKNALPMP